MKKAFKILIVLIGVLAIVYLVGPKPKHPIYTPVLPQLNYDYKKSDSFVAAQEANFKIKPENESRIIWQDSLKNKTKYVILYLPGFTASQEEGDPVHTNIAKKLGCNLYLARLYGHGLQDTLHTFEDFTVDKYWESTLNAYSIASKLGDSLIIMSTSTGSTLGLRLAAMYKNIAAQVLISPNIEINDPNAWLLNNPWGKQIATLVKGGTTLYSRRQDEIYKKYWNLRYHVNGVVQLQELIETSMTKKIFSQVTAPTCLLYYYKDEAHQDPVVKVSAMKKMFDQLATPSFAKEQHAITNAEKHVLASYIESPNIITAVEDKIFSFLNKTLRK
jgi:alpha-beta hydrolase superfamily lysophospholipase